MSALTAEALAGNGPHARVCCDLLRDAVPNATPFLTSSCTDALEMAALVLDIGPGDEVVMPSWTFPSTANAFALRGASPVFVDIEPGTLNIDPNLVAAAITPRTRAVVCVHYGGVACRMDELRSLCGNRIALVEDAAQAYGASWRGRPLGGIGDIGTFSFHSTKNISSGEGGAFILACRDLLPRAEIAWEKGTNRLRYVRGEVESYQWCDLGSSFLMSDITAALLSVQLRAARDITRARRAAWARYAALIASSGLRLPCSGEPEGCNHNGHMFFVQLASVAARLAVEQAMRHHEVETRRHYRPLHLSPAGHRLGRVVGDMRVTEAADAGLLRLPLHPAITAAQQELVVAVLVKAAAQL